MRAKYSKQIYLGYSPEGKQIRRRVYGDTLTELKAEERKARADFDLVRNPSEITFGDYAERWLKIYKASRSPSTLYMYRSAFKHCASVWNIPLRKLTRSDYQSLVSACADRPNTANKLSLTLMQILRTASSDGIIPYPTWRFERIKENKAEQSYLSDEEMIRIFEVELPLRDKLFVRLIGTFGLRPHEAFALSRDSIRGSSLIIDRAVGYDGNIPFIKTTKNRKTRTLPLPESIISLLSAYIADLRGFYLFANEDGELMTRYQSQRYSRQICDAVGINNLYILRHTVATKLYYKISPKLASYYLGHSEQIFISTYSHLDRTKEPRVNVFE